MRNPDGYGRLRNVNQRYVGSHIYAWWLATGIWPEVSQVIAHICDVRHCVRNDEAGVYVLDGIEYERHGHLWLGTNVANTRDRHLKGRTATGERSGVYTHPETRASGLRHGTYTKPESRVTGERQWFSKLTTAQVLEMRALAAAGATNRELSNRFGVVISAVYGIVHRRSWKHI